MEVLPSSESATESQAADSPTIHERQLSETAFDHLSWVYTLCRERLFQDDTEEIIQILVSFGLNLNGACLVDLVCGPGFYSSRVAKRFRLLNVIGVDAWEVFFEKMKGVSDPEQKCKIIGREFIVGFSG
jgi:hypothetical protein